MMKSKTEKEALYDLVEKASPDMNETSKLKLSILDLFSKSSQVGLFLVHQGTFIYQSQFAKSILNKLLNKNISRDKKELVSQQYSFESTLKHIQAKNDVLIREFRVIISQKIRRFRIVFEGMLRNKELYILGTIFDITEEKRIEEERRLIQEQLFRIQKMESLNTLARGLSHDFNNILSSILGNIALAKTESPEKSQQLIFLKNIENSARRGVQLVSELLAYSQTDPLDKKVFSLNTLISDSIGICKTTISKKILLHHQLMPELPPIEADLQQIQQVVITLCLNAARAIGDNAGIVTITSGLVEVDDKFCKNFQGFLIPKVGSHVFFEIHDTGEGINKVDIQKIFDPYYQQSANLSNHGFELSNALDIINKNNGFVEISSSDELGTSVIVYLPISLKQILPGEKELARILENVETVLLVDDEEIVQITIKGILKRLGYSVFTADNGQQAIQLFQRLKDQIDLILLDLTMPVMGGADALNEIRKIRPDVSVILFSGFNRDEAIRRLPAQNITGFMEKPVLIDELGKRVQEFFEKQKK